MVFLLSSLLSLLSGSIFSAGGRKNRGDWTPLELFIAGVRGWEVHLRRRLADARMAMKYRI
jgi:hypothetical protein